MLALEPHAKLRSAIRIWAPRVGSLSGNLHAARHRRGSAVVETDARPFLTRKRKIARRNDLVGVDVRTVDRDRRGGEAIKGKSSSFRI